MSCVSACDFTVIQILNISGLFMDFLIQGTSCIVLAFSEDRFASGITLRPQMLNISQNYGLLLRLFLAFGNYHELNIGWPYKDLMI